MKSYRMMERLVIETVQSNPHPFKGDIQRKNLGHGFSIRLGLGLVLTLL